MASNDTNLSDMLYSCLEEQKKSDSKRDKNNQESFTKRNDYRNKKASEIIKVTTGSTVLDKGQSRVPHGKPPENTHQRNFSKPDIGPNLSDFLYSSLQEQRGPSDKNQDKSQKPTNLKPTKVDKFSNRQRCNSDRDATVVVNSTGAKVLNTEHPRIRQHNSLQNTRQRNVSEPGDGQSLSDLLYSSLQEQRGPNDISHHNNRRELGQDKNEDKFQKPTELKTGAVDKFSNRQRCNSDHDDSERYDRNESSSSHFSKDGARNSSEKRKHSAQNIEPMHPSTGAVKKRNDGGNGKESSYKQGNRKKNSTAEKVENVTECSSFISTNNKGNEYRNQRDFDRNSELNKNKGRADKENSNTKHNNNNYEVPFKLISYKKLEELANGPSSELVIALANQYVGFENRLKETLSPDWIMLVVKALCKVSQADFQENKSSILSYASEMHFLQQVSEYLMKLPFENHIVRQANIENFLKNLLVFYETLLNLLPHRACDVLEKIIDTTERSMTCVEACQQNIKISPAMKEKLMDLSCRLRVRMGEQEHIYDKKTSIRNIANENPPNDFRTLTVYPTPNDILSNEKPFIRPNIVRGAYSSVEHYLDIQFRLLREDFVCPLREAVTEFVCNIETGNRKKKLNNVRIYHQAYFVNPVIVKDKVGLLVCFDENTSRRKRPINWEANRRFMFGSLLCFSRDNFATVFFGTVIDRSIKDLKDGLITVMLKDAGDITDDLFSSSFILAESEVYFEPYYHVLNALQHMKADDFPMKRYIVEVENTSKPPEYVTTSAEFEYFIDGHMVKITNDLTWPSAVSLDLDESQYRAFKSALTKEFVVIQGPPGTGKTFLGLKIVKVLLDNAPVWNATQKPILVVCYTNHALDQFLEGLMPYTDKLVRVGGQSKSELLSKFNLREKQRSTLLPPNIRFLMRDIRDRINGAMLQIKRIQLDVECIKSHEGIVSFGLLKNTITISNEHVQCFKDDDGPINEWLFIEWLKIGFEEFKRNGAAARIDPEVQEIRPDDEQPADVVDEDQNYNPQPPEDILDVELDLSNVSSGVQFSFHLNNLRKNIEWITAQLTDLQIQNQHIPQPTRKEIELACQLEELYVTVQYWKTSLSYKHKLDRAVIDRILAQRDLWQLQPTDRWILYKFWLEQFLLTRITNLRALEESIRRFSKLYEEAKQMGDLIVMQKSLVIGMTTTGAARLQPLLRALKPRIVVVEEAAEVMESHIVVSLTSHCHHLILIGDHQQLRPNTAVYRLAKDYHFDISLFERMLNNGMHCEVLKVQHRMRPEIVKLIVPTIYPELLNHHSVYSYSHINGVVKSMFFITHTHPEEEVNDSESRRNIHEAEFLMALARHLVLQGYSPEQITILATYSGQMFDLRSLRKNYHMLKGTRISVVDNFQGEENDIILLSLVRSNPEAKIGFLKTENRVCVALSRAKMGFYIIGNMNNLTKSSSVWPKIKESLEQQESLNTFLTLRCQIHTTQFTKVSTADDFHQVPEGGCNLPCDSVMPCGHKCQSVCHILNREHKDYKCLEKCERVPKKCSFEHKCMKLCWEDCGPCTTIVSRDLPCGHTQNMACDMDPAAFRCQVMLDDVELDCKHKVRKPCFRDIETFPCSYDCEYRLNCGHKCELRCHIKSDPDHIEYKCFKPCAKKNFGCTGDHPCQKRCSEECGPCLVEVKKMLPCTHTHEVACSANPKDVICRRKCKRALPCGHFCPLTCDKPCGGCQVKVTKVIPACGHAVKVKCYEVPEQRMCKYPCERMLPCGHKCTNPCSIPCTTQCTEKVPSYVRAACQHPVNVPCFKRNFQFDPLSQELMSYCQMPCRVLLECEHRCKGTCSECLQGRIHKSCSETCGKLLICGHKCTSPCSQSCPPCNKNCTLRCVHSKCRKKCGEPCTPCTEPCSMGCQHMRCNKPCHEICDRDPCNEPCPKLLKCGHQCIGLCGDKCPPLCRVCNVEEVTAIFFGTEDEEDARFVLLEDCKHVFESSGLEQWMSQSDKEIKLKVCPKCTTPILQTQRYMNIVKNIFKDVSLVKEKVFGDIKKIEESRSVLKTQLELLPPPVEFGTVSYEKIYNKLERELNEVRFEARTKRKNVLTGMDVETLRIQMSILSLLTNMVIKIQPKLSEEAMERLFKYMDILIDVLLKREKKISGQEIDDFTLEAKRFERFCQFALLESEPVFRTTRGNPELSDSHKKVCDIAYCIEKYSTEQDFKFQNLLEEFKKKLNSAVVLTQKERTEIVKAMGVKQGAWYKCPNGHIYAIDDCGGAMEVARCYECGAQIGGTQHRLLASNQLASEMDGATRPAWPQ